MSKRDLNTQADELAALLESKPAVDPTAPVIDESYLLAEPATESPEQVAANENDELLPELVRSIVDYALRRAPANASARTIGEAIGEGVFEASNQLKLNDGKLVEAVDAFLNELHDSVLSKLAGE